MERPAPDTPVPLEAGNVDAAAEVLVRAFADDPGVLFVLPDRAKRERLGPALARAMIQFVARCGTPLVTTGTIRGVALWFPPDAIEPNGEDLIDTGMADVPDLIGADAMARFKRLADRLDALHPQLAPGPHWYLAMLGVDPDWQRQGIGDALMQPVFQAADHAGLCCYLEAPTADNARYYGRRGFQVVAETAIPDSSVHIWHMRRDPVN
jgi:GNAT superfamily N-acetyltransferase